MGEPKYWELEIREEIWERPKRLFKVKNTEPHLLQDIRNVIDGRGE